MTTTPNFISRLLLVALLLVAGRLAADEQPYREFGGYRVHYSAFNSTILNPQIAAAHDIVRGSDRGLVNIAVMPVGAVGGRPAEVSGRVGNLFGQNQELKFLEVREDDAVYYLAPFRFANEDALTFTITVKPTPDAEPQTLSFQRTFYRER